MRSVLSEQFLKRLCKRAPETSRVIRDMIKQIYAGVKYAILNHQVPVISALQFIAVTLDSVTGHFQCRVAQSAIFFARRRQVFAERIPAQRARRMSKNTRIDYYIFQRGILRRAAAKKDDVA